VLARLVIAGFALIWVALVVAWTPDNLD